MASVYHSSALASASLKRRMLSRKQVQASKVVKIAQGVVPVRIRLAFAVLVIPFIAVLASPLCRAQAANSPLLQIEAWRKAVLAGESGALAAMYSDSPKIIAPATPPPHLNTYPHFSTPSHP